MNHTLFSEETISKNPTRDNHSSLAKVLSGSRCLTLPQFWPEASAHGSQSECRIGDVYQLPCNGLRYREGLPVGTLEVEGGFLSARIQ